MRSILLGVAAALAALAAPAQASTGAAEPPTLPAAAWYLVGEDGAVLAQQSSRHARAIASITKLMTAIVALEEARPSDLVQVSSLAAGVGGSTVYLRAGEELTVGELVRAMLIPSANDAATALALHVGNGSTARFVSLMNAKARELGLVDTTFVNAHGLDEPGHLSSARDTTLLVRYALGVSSIRDALGRSSFSLSGGQEFPTTDDLLASWPPLLGGKTGHTQGAGWSEAAAASMRGATVYGTVLGVDTREGRNDALRTLLEFGLDRYQRVAVIDASRAYGQADTEYGRPHVGLVASRTLLRTVREGVPLLERTVLPTMVGLPVRKGERLGRVEVWEGDRLVASSNLIAAESISEPGNLGKAVWFAERTAENIWELVT
ncbi:MAG: D-alanyl-D-alanine carboxypeptidase [Actinomycetota bacterium]|nr:D-alanyl-D-alanine carboxypeptidase [Actinomycetota bacterium]